MITILSVLSGSCVGIVGGFVVYLLASALAEDGKVLRTALWLWGLFWVGFLVGRYGQ